MTLNSMMKYDMNKLLTSISAVISENKKQTNTNLKELVA